MASITGWTRIEPRSRDATLATTLTARLYDPLWLLARQWQTGELTASDGGSPVSAKLRHRAALLTRFAPGALASAAVDLDVVAAPLEALAERESPASTSRWAAQSGARFAQCLTDAGLSAGDVSDWRAAYTMTSPAEADREDVDERTLRFRDLAAGRAIDGVALYAALRAAAPGLPALPAVPADRRTRTQNALDTWLSWYDSFASAPDSASTWVKERLEYSFGVAAPGPDRERVLVAAGYPGGRLDWDAFSVHSSGSLGAIGSASVTEQVRTLLPSPALYRGMPRARWWEMEDAAVDFGDVEAAADDLARMAFLEFALVYGNDWFIVPLDLSAGSVCTLDALVVTDTFGTRSVLKPTAQAMSDDWRIFTLAREDGSAESGVEPPLFFMAPALPQDLHGPAIEAVRFLRDEMANMAWAVERVVEADDGQPLDRHEREQERKGRLAETASERESATPVSELAYTLAKTTPEHWIPLAPVQTGTGGMRLQRRAMMRAAEGGGYEAVLPRGRILEPDVSDYRIYEEEVPRAGLHVRRQWQLTRWVGGATLLWLGRGKSVGRGEGSSGLRFDSVALSDRS